MRFLQFVLGALALSVTVSLVSSADGSREGRPFGEALKISPLPSSAEEMPPEHEFFNGLSTEESFSVWENFVPAWQRNFHHRYRLWTNIDPAGFAFSEKCQSDCGAVEMSAEVRSEEVLVKPVSLKNLTFKLADSSLVLLRNAGVPEEILVTLAPLTNRTFENESQLSSELLRALGEDKFEEYQDVILQNSYVNGTLFSPWALARLKNIGEQNDSLFSYKKNSSSLLGEKMTQNSSKGVRTSRSESKESWLDKLRAFCDKWGLPRPRTLLLLLILFYLTASLIKSFVQSRQ